MGKYFTINELCVSGSYPKLVEVPAKGTTIYNNLVFLIERLDVIREKWNGPIIVTSGYRSEKLNKAVGGSRTSYHRLGLAADIHPKSGSIIGLAECIVNSGLEFDQLILEYVTVKNNEIIDCKWVHVGFSRVNPRKQILAWNGNQYIPVKITTETKFKV